MIINSVFCSQGAKSIIHLYRLTSQQRWINSSSVNWKIIIDKSKFPTLDENDLEEKFVTGSGPGGQCVNKSSNACFIKHLPTGITVKSHEHRSLEQNRKRARELLLNQLDNLINDDMSIEAQKKAIAEKKSRNREQKARKRNLMKQEWKAQQEEDLT